MRLPLQKLPLFPARIDLLCGFGMCVVCFLFSLTGCARWSQESVVETKKPVLAQPKMSPDSVVVETVVVRFPREQTEVLDTVWASVDESLLPMNLRRALAENGLRCGVLEKELPIGVRNRLNELSDSDTAGTLEQAGLAADIENLANRFQCRAGMRKDVHIRREQRGPLIVIANREGNLEGASYEDASMLFDMRTVPHGDGTATISLVPEVQYGEPRKTFISSGSGMRPEMRRDYQNWDRLKISIKLRPGQIMVLSSNGEPKAPNLGRAFFVTHTAEQTDEQAVLLVRLASTQLDDLFAPDEVQKAKATSER
jgi:hypothetical protein